MGGHSNEEQGQGHGQEDMTNVTDPYDSDVLCGRGGAALRHPGNQTYRRLVNLNKGLYITCHKTEKLNISRSVVTAIRDQRGRFLEKNKDGTWHDIGDKKAIEKTSQALREGQPKLRQKIVEMGGVAGSTALMESQFPGGADLYGGNNNNSDHADSAGNNGMMPLPAQQHPYHQQQQAAMAATQQQQRQYLQQGQGEGRHSVRQQQELQELQSMHMQQQQHQQNELRHELVLQRLSLQGGLQGSAEIDRRYMQHQHQQHQHQHQQQQHQHYNQQQLQQLHQQQQRDRLHGRGTGDGLSPGSMHSAMSNFSGICGNEPRPGSMQNESLMSMDAPYHRALNNLTGSQYSPEMSQFGSIESLLMGMNNQSKA
jgi:hypothetical protein